MEEYLDLFDMDWRGFERAVFQRGGVINWEGTPVMTWSMVRGVLVSLAYMLWILGRQVKKLEKEE